jgi:peptide methionine sulfoxide reductase MsrB
MARCGGTTLVEVFRDMAEETKPEACNHCKEQVTKSRHAEPHKHLRLLKTGSPYVNPYGMGGGVDSFYRCDLCGAKMFHSTDNYDFGWQL